MLERLVLKSPIQRTSRRVKWTLGARDMNNSLSLKRCIVFSVCRGPKLLKLFLCVVFFDLRWGRPRLALTAALYHQACTRQMLEH